MASRRYQEPVTGERALVGLEGFMKGWTFGSSIMREDEDRKDREQKRKDEADDRAWKGEERNRTRTGWTQADEDRQYTIDTRETPDEIKGRRKTAAELQAESLTAAQRGNRQAPTDAEALEERTLGLEGKRIGNKNAKDANTRAWNDDRRQGEKAKRDAEKDSGGKVLAALDYFQRNQALLDPAKMNSVERLYTAFSTGNMSKASREDVKASADVIAPVLDKRTDFNGMPIVERSYTPLFKDGKIVLEVAYKVKKPDGSIIDASAGPIRRATADGTDAIYEMDDADAMQLLAAHTLLGRDIKKMVDAGYSNPNDAINELREAYIAQQGGSGVDELKKIDPKATAGLTREKIRFGDSELTVQIDKDVGMNDDTPVVAGVVEDPKTGNAVAVRTIGEARQVLGLPAPTQQGAPAVQANPIVDGVMGGARSAAAGRPAFVTPSASKPPGLVEQGNIDINARPTVKLPNGQIATVNSMSFQAEKGGPEILIPQVSDDGRMLTAKEAIKEYERTGKHLGKFRTPDEATAYAKTLHEDQDKQYSKSGGGAQTVKSQSEVAALPKGAKFIFNGKEYTKK